eukprot:Sspe_Gene.108322::Locus_87463_Transcript_1_1_Confidence_1.000_Length_458::g.108322::m.108322
MLQGLILLGVAVALAAADSNCTTPSMGCNTCGVLPKNSTCVTIRPDSNGTVYTTPDLCTVVANPDPVLLGKALEFICGAGTGVRCECINEGGCCYSPNTPVSHAKWAFQQYYALKYKVSGSYACSFNG